MDAQPSPTPHAELLRLVRTTRHLLAAERDAGVTEVHGTQPPARPEPAAPDRAPPARRATGHTAPPERSTPAPGRAVSAQSSSTRTSSAQRAFVPRVPALDLPPDALAPFGDLPARVAACTACRLCETRTHTVFGEGDARARLVFCGEGPGFDEDRSGRPFVGRAGELLSKMIENGLKLRREQVFILNAVKCRPPENRTPLPDEIAACRPFLDAQLEVLAPDLIVALGNPATHALLGDVGGITRVRGKVFDRGGVRVVPTFHPAYLLRNQPAKREAWEDLKLVMRLLDGASPSG